MRLFVGNLSDDVTEEDLEAAFSAFGTVKSVSIARDKYGSMSKGFGFVDMPRKAEARAAIKELDLKELKGRAMVVNEARPKGGGGRGGGGGRKRRGRRR